MNDEIEKENPTAQKRPVLIEYRARSKVGTATIHSLDQHTVMSPQPRFNMAYIADEFSIGVPEALRNNTNHRLTNFLANVPGLEVNEQTETQPHFKIKGLTIDDNFAPIRVEVETEEERILGFGAFGISNRKASTFKKTEFLTIRAIASDEAISEVTKNPDVVEVWDDFPIQPFDDVLVGDSTPVQPITICQPELSIDNKDPIGNLTDVARVLNLPSLHSQGLKGQGVIIGIMDGGVNLFHAQDAVPNLNDRIIGGWPINNNNNVAKWGQRRGQFWHDHAQKCAETVSALAPDVKMWDLRIADSGNNAGLLAPGEPAFMSNALAALDWALAAFRQSKLTTSNPQPKVINCSWGIYQALQSPQYATNPNHLLVRKFTEAMDAGMIIIFAAGNCGKPCKFPDVCGDNTGFGNSILGMNGHERSICVTSSTKDGQYIPYSSQGPAAMSPHRNPDICGISHFATLKGTYFNGTSAAAPVVSACVALMVQRFPNARQEDVKKALTETADIEVFEAPANHSQYVGAGLIQPHQALKLLGDIMANHQNIG